MTTTFEERERKENHSTGHLMWGDLDHKGTQVSAAQQSAAKQINKIYLPRHAL